MASIFVSHSSLDAEQSNRLLAWLRARGFDQTFLDIDKHGGITPGHGMEEEAVSRDHSLRGRPPRVDKRLVSQKIVLGRVRAGAWQGDLCPIKIKLAYD